MTSSKLRLLVAAAALAMSSSLVLAQQAAQSTQRSAVSPVHSPAAPASSSVPKTAAAAKPAGVPAASGTPAATEPDAQLVQDARNAGFRPAKIRGTLMFCRTAIELGSNFPVRTCYNGQQTRVKIQEYQAQRDQLRQGHFLPPGPPPGCSPRSCQ